MIYRELYPWQRQIIDDFYEKESFGIFLDMGLGKTPISLSFAEEHRSDKILIITINKKALEEEEIEGSFFWWLKKADIPYNLYNKKCNFRNEGAKKWRREISSETKDVLIINYEALYDHNQSSDRLNRCELSNIIKDFVKSCKNQTVTLICDESHKLKTYDSLRTKALRKIQKELQENKNELYTYLLTGTPFTTGYEDLYSQLKILGWEGTKGFFKDQFCILGRILGLMEWQQPVIGYKNIDQLYNLIHRFAITIKSGSVVDLPEQVFVHHKLKQTDEMIMMSAEEIKRDRLIDFYNKRNLEIPENIKQSSNKQINNPFYRNIAFPEPKWIAETSGSFWMRCRQLSIGFQGNSEEYYWYDRSRLEELKNLLEDNPDNYVLFYNYDAEFYELFDLCENLGYKIDVCNGSIKSEYFYQKYLKQTPGEKLVNNKNIILANYGSGSEGGNWQAFNKCIFFSLPQFSNYEQALKRIHRIGQKETVIYHIFYSENWLDRSMLKALEQKKEYNNEMFESDLKRVQNILSVF